MREKIKKLAESLKADITNFTRDIVAIPSITGDEGPVIERIMDEMKKLGYEKIYIDGMGNLHGRIGTGERLLAIDGHVDTVEIGNIDSWHYDPFKGKFENGIIYGRGACDQKGGLASAVYAGKIINEIGIPEDVTLLVVASVQEEVCEGLNWQYIIKEEKIKPDAVILTEPSNLTISKGHRGRIDIKVQVSGISCHGSAPDLGDNAIYKIAPIAKEVEDLHKNLNSEPVFGKGSIVVTKIHSDSPSINALADFAEIHLDRRLNANDTLESCLEEVTSLPSVKKVNAKVFVPEYDVKSHTGLIYPINAYYASWTMDEDHDIIQAASKAFKDQFEEKPVVKHWNFSTNGVATKGIYDIPTFGFGPADEKYAHTVNDQVPVEHLVRAMEFYSTFVFNWK